MPKGQHGRPSGDNGGNDEGCNDGRGNDGGGNDGGGNGDQTPATAKFCSPGDATRNLHHGKFAPEIGKVYRSAIAGASTKKITTVHDVKSFLQHTQGYKELFEFFEYCWNAELKTK